MLLPMTSTIASQQVSVSWVLRDDHMSHVTVSVVANQPLDSNAISNKRPTGLNDHLIISDSTPSFCQKGSYMYLHIKTHHIINKKQ